jgi:hypothetical protein
VAPRHDDTDARGEARRCFGRSDRSAERRWPRHQHWPSVTVQSGRRLEERVLEQVGSVAPGSKACVHTQLDHAAQPIPVALEQVRQRLAVTRPESLNEM